MERVVSDMSMKDNQYDCTKRVCFSTGFGFLSQSAAVPLMLVLLNGHVASMTAPSTVCSESVGQALKLKYGKTRIY